MNTRTSPLSSPRSATLGIGLLTLLLAACSPGSAIAPTTGARTNVDSLQNAPDSVAVAEAGQKTAPVRIEDLNRSPVYTPKPDFPEKVNADVKMRVTVDPQGHVVQVSPIQQGNPSLERAVQDALQRWRFNALPSNVPQVNQTGIVTIRFRME